mmetsp:Transcript_20385/g.30148  ORF Transcript_20385/g.30148 Transcript_20385/m.30148 type:complete len:504 (-) Transcript_20385:473-1984(-)
MSEVASSANPHSDQKTVSFPPDFQWGTATAAYQIEGGHDDGNRGPSIWDTFSRKLGRDTGDVACNHYHLYSSDVELMQSLGIRNYRFSISWSRILPNGVGDVNTDGIDYYNRLIDCLLSHGIEPLVTLYHWDLPESLNKGEYEGGWVNPKIITPFVEYAKICFESFGDRVKTWLTFNEPWCVCVLGYGNGEHAPGRTSHDGSEVYMSGHTILLSHARAVKLYRERFQSTQKGKIGITLNGNWSEPFNKCDKNSFLNNIEASKRSLLWSVGWFADPIWLGDYPSEMRGKCGDRLPTFQDDEKALIKGSSDFFGLNHYSTDLVKDSSMGKFTSHWGTTNSGGYFGDQGIESFKHPDWSTTDMGWSVVPWGFKKLLVWCQRRYAPTGGIYVTENGCAVKEDDVKVAENDHFRVSYLKGYIASMREAMDQGADVRGYFAWSFMDNFEWSLGYSKRFGLVHNDYNTQKRTPKASAFWFAELCKNNSFMLEKEARFMDAAGNHYSNDSC